MKIENLQKNTQLFRRWRKACHHFRAIAFVIGTIIAMPMVTSAAESVAANPPDEIRQLREQLAVQTRRIDRLYDALGPQLAEMEERAAVLWKQKAEDAALAMKEVFRLKDDALTDKLIFLPHSQVLAIAQTDKTVKTISVNGALGSKILAGLDAVALCLAASADGSKLFAGTQKGSIYVCELSATNFHKIFDWNGWPVSALAVSPDGTLLVCACNGKYGTNRTWIESEESLLAIETATGQKLWNGKAGRSDFHALSFAGDGKTVAVVQGGYVALLDAATGQALRKLEHEKCPSGPLSTAMSRDGRLCAAGYAPNDVGIWDASESKCLRLLGAHSNWVVALAFSPDGSLLASSAGDSTASVWEVATGKELGRFRFGDGPAYVNSISISDDGRWLAAGRRGEVVVFKMPQKPHENK